MLGDLLVIDCLQSHANQIALNLSSMTFMVGIGLGVARVTMKDKSGKSLLRINSTKEKI